MVNIIVSGTKRLVKEMVKGSRSTIMEILPSRDISKIINIMEEEEISFMMVQCMRESIKIMSVMDLANIHNVVMEWRKAPMKVIL